MSFAVLSRTLTLIGLARRRNPPGAPHHAKPMGSFAGVCGHGEDKSAVRILSQRGNKRVREKEWVEGSVSLVGG